MKRKMSPCPIYPIVNRHLVRMVLSEDVFLMIYLLEFLTGILRGLLICCRYMRMGLNYR